MEKIFYDNTLIAIRLKRLKNGVISLTEPSEPLQVLGHKRNRGEYIKAHIHEPKKRVTEKLQECLMVVKGKIIIDLYSPTKKFFKSVHLSAGDIVIFMNGGHGVHILDDSEIIEVKNGPFVEDKELIE